MDSRTVTATSQNKLENIFLMQELFGDMVPHFRAVERAYWRRCSWRDKVDWVAPIADRLVIVRSGAFNEDIETYPGQYSSEVTSDPIQVIAFIDNLFKAYDHPDDSDTVIVQDYISRPSYAGVASSVDSYSGMPYVTIEYDTDGTTNGITSGCSRLGRRTYMMAGLHSQSGGLCHPFADLCHTMEQLVAHTGSEVVVEFAMEGNKLWLLQFNLLELETVLGREESLQFLSEEVAALTLTKSENKRFGYSQMSDWNPVELIGYKPVPFSTSLFAYLFSDENWWKARVDLGYSKPGTSRLVSLICGTPYVNLAASFESLIPQGIGSPLKDRLLDLYLERLRKNPQYHDKVEFEVILGARNLIEEACPYHLSETEQEEVDQAFGDLFSKILGSVPALDMLEEFRNSLVNAIDKGLDNASPRDLLSRMSQLAYIFCKAARLAFIFRSLSGGKIEMGRETELFNRYQIDSDALDLFLRPGLFDPMRAVRSVEGTAPKALGAILAQTDPIGKLLADLDPAFPWSQLKPPSSHLLSLTFFYTYLREQIKSAIFVVSNQLFIDLVERFGKQTSFLDIQEVLAGDFPSQDELAFRHSQHQVSRNLRVPGMIWEPRELYCFDIDLNVPNFFGSDTVQGDLLVVKDHCDPELVKGRVILLENADPGFDFLFRSEPLAIVTAYGGQNSHVAIRCLSQGIRCVTGIGVVAYEYLLEQSAVRIDFEGQKLEGI